MTNTRHISEQHERGGLRERISRVAPIRFVVIGIAAAVLGSLPLYLMPGATKRIHGIHDSIPFAIEYGGTGTPGDPEWWCEIQMTQNERLCPQLVYVTWTVRSGSHGRERAQEELKYGTSTPDAAALRARLQSEYVLPVDSSAVKFGRDSTMFGASGRAVFIGTYVTVLGFTFFGCIPVVVGCVVLASLSAQWRRAEGKRCVKCGYSLDGMVESRCPECGAYIK
ncbi:MAG: hypothetical protein AABZ53_12450 [Planctomycetota bacterium]